MDQATAAQPGRAAPAGGTHWFIWAFLFLLFAYPLSTGPARKLTDVHLFSRSAYSAVYIPIAFIRLRCPPADRLYAWYVYNLWDCNFLPSY